MAILPCSPVRMRTQSSRGSTKILPSPILTGVARPGGVDDRFDGSFHERFVDANLQFELRQQADLDFGAAVGFGVAALPAAAAHVADGHQIDLAFASAC